jgi:hypothetical protein
VGQARKIRVLRSGGVAGIAATVELGPDDLTEDELKEVERLLDVGAQRPATAEPLGPADRFQYDVTIERGDEARHVTVHEGDLDREQRRLLKSLLRRPPAS